MGITFQDAAKRIIICGVEELSDIFKQQDISLVVSTCSEEECANAITVSDKTTSAQAIIDMASLNGTEQYQSLLYQTYGDFLDRYTPEPMSPEEEQSYFYEQACNTLHAIEEALTTQSEKKVVIHCVYGSDRSAMVSIAYFLKCQGEDADINEALKALQKLRPDARLEGISQQFQSYFGADFNPYRQAIIDYRDTLKMREQIPLSIPAKDFFMSNHPTSNQWQAYQKRCSRFGIDPNSSL